jgi:uncharacterized ubiquitin-like protein YukD
MKLKLTVGEQVIEMEVSEEATLEDLRSAVGDSKGIPITRIRLISKAKILTKNVKLKDLNIKEGDTIIVIIKKVLFSFFF